MSEDIEKIARWIADACNPYPKAVDPPSTFTDTIVRDIQRRIDSGQYVPADRDEGEEWE